LRVLVLRSTWRQADAVEAQGMLMASQAAHGHFSLVVWGASAGGTIATFIAAPFVALFGLHLWLFHVIDGAEALVCVLLLWAVGRRFLPDLAAAIAAGIFWFFPANWLFLSSKEFVYWLPAIAFALAACLFVLRWFDTRQPVNLWVLGLCVGLSVWSYYLVYPLILPALAVFVWVERRHAAVLGRVAVAAVIGVSPWFVHFAWHGGAQIASAEGPGGKLTHLKASVSQILPAAFLGGQRRVGLLWQSMNPSLSRMDDVGTLALMAILLIFVIALLRREFAVAVCAVSVFVWPIAMTISGVPAEAASYRYGLILVAPVLLLAVYVFSRIPVLMLLLALGALVMVLVTTWSVTSGYAAAPACDRGVSAVSRYLAAQQRTRVWAAYWLAAPLEVCSDEQVTAGEVPPIVNRSAATAAAQAPRSTYVVFADNTLDRQIMRWAETHPDEVSNSTVGGFSVWEFADRVTPAEMRLSGEF
jgi:Dolichyl-phosphate-mannose-protein mannosyltransferase